MGLGRSKKVLAAGLGLLLVAGSSFSDYMMDDFDDGNNKNELGTYWYFYTDVRTEGTSTIGGESTEPLFVGDYEGKEGTLGALMDFSLCMHDEAVMGEYNLPNVNFGVNFNSTETAFDLTGATAISFDIKGSAAMVVRFLVQMDKDLVNVGDNDYHKLIDVTDAWQKVTVALAKDPVAGLKQETGWGKVVPFAINKVAKLAWRVGVKDNEDLEGKAGKLYIDNVNIVGDPAIKLYGTADSIVALGAFSGTGLLSDFENEENPFSNALEYYWYSYTDDGVNTNKMSEFTTGVIDETMEVDATGGAKGTSGFSFDFKLGNRYYDENAEDSVLPFLGFGTNLRDDGKSTSPYYDATTDGATGIYVEYKSTAAVNMELYDSKTRGGGIDYFVILPSSKGEWQGVVVPFSKFVLPDWASASAALDKSKLAKLQFKVTGAPGLEGSFAIDNVYLMNAKLTGIKAIKPRFAAKGIMINQSRTAINIDFNRSIRDAKVSLIDPLGKTVAMEKINTKSRSCSIPLFNRANGVYFLKVSSDNFVETAKIHIAK